MYCKTFLRIETDAHIDYGKGETQILLTARVGKLGHNFRAKNKAYDIPVF